MVMFLHPSKDVYMIYVHVVGYNSPQNSVFNSTALPVACTAHKVFGELGRKNRCTYKCILNVLVKTSCSMAHSRGHVQFCKFREGKTHVLNV